MISAFRDFHPAKLDHNTQILLGDMLTRNSPYDVSLVQGPIFYQIHHSSELHLYVLSPTLDNILQTIVIERVSKFSDISVSLLQKQVIILVKSLDHLILYHGYQNGFIGEKARIALPTIHSLIFISEVLKKQQAWSWICVTQYGMELYVEYWKQQKKMQLQELNPQKGISNLIKDWFKPILPPKHRVSHGKGIFWEDAKKNILAFILKDFILQVRFAKFTYFPHDFDILWQTNFAEVLPNCSKIVSSNLFSSQQQKSPLFHIFLAIHSTHKLQLFHFLFDISNKCKQIKAKATLPFPHYSEIVQSGDDLYLLMQKEQEWRLEWRDIHTFNEIRVWSWSRIKSTFKLMMIDNRILLVSQGASYFIHEEKKEEIEIEHFQYFLRDQTRKKKYQKLLALEDWDIITSQFRVQLQNQSRSSQEYYLVTFILKLLQHKSIEKIISTFSQPQQFCQSLIIDMSISAIQDLIFALASMQEIKYLTHIFQVIFKDRPSHDLSQFLFDNFRTSLLSVLEHTFALPQNFTFEQNQLLNLLIHLHCWVGKVEQIDNYLIIRYLREERKGWRDLQDGTKVIMNIAMEIGWVKIVKFLFKEGFIFSKNVLEFLDQMRIKNYQNLKQTVKQFLHDEIKKGKSLTLLNLMPETFHSMIEEYLLQAYPKVAIYFHIKNNHRQKIADYIIKNQHILMEFENPSVVYNLLEPLQEYDQDNEGRKVIASNRVLAMMMSELSHPFVTVKRLEQIRKSGKKLDLKIPRQVWNKHQLKIERETGNIMYWKVVNALMIPL